MKGLGAKKLSNDLDLGEDFKNNDPVIASGNLRALTIKVNGPLIVHKNLETIEGSIGVNGPLTVEGEVVCQGGLKVNGSCKVQGKIQAETVKVNGWLTAESVEATTVKINGKVRVSQDINAIKSITIGVSRKFQENVEGRLIAPEVTLRYQKRGFASLILRIFGMKTQFSEEITLENMSIKTDVLQLENVNVEGNIEAKKIVRL